MKLVEGECGKDELLTEVRRYAAIKRLERRNPNAMDVDIVAKSPKRAPQEMFGNATLQPETMAWPWIHACTENEEAWEEYPWASQQDPWGN